MITWFCTRSLYHFSPPHRELNSDGWDDTTDISRREATHLPGQKFLNLTPGQNPLRTFLSPRSLSSEGPTKQQVDEFLSPGQLQATQLSRRYCNRGKKKRFYLVGSKKGEILG